MTTDFKVILQIHVHETGHVVSFKHDGQRFEQSHTVKLNTNTEYELIFTVQPALHMEKLMINGEEEKLELCRDNNDEYEDVKTYKTQYETVGYDVCRRGKRKEINFVIELENGTHLKFSIQCKMYKCGETEHTQWGQKLAGLELDCRIEEGHTYVAVIKDKYF